MPISIPVSAQPVMSLAGATYEKRPAPAYYDDYEESQWAYDAAHPHGEHGHGHGPCHNTRLKQFLPYLLLLVLALSAAAATAYLFYIGLSTEADAGELLQGLFHAKRAVDGTDSGNSGSPFTRNHLYLIVVFVGLLVVVILAVMLSAWCCRGAFENPLCCPCYLCACCGGLACLECIGCGLCAEGVEQM
ncbi:hypothetical protein FB45DRAFT_901190 [Roridomyces roridus]|uniref:Transmembrane protein n=1 Tax=Roridomyces roridus TaxID=1738132 RepID=A0AAD7CAF1_9AGAR|nr:hypothetical protein FB45DRAFT_901190 [Roridomyces roridus]